MEVSAVYNIIVNIIKLYELVLIIVIRHYINYILSERRNRALPFI